MAYVSQFVGWDSALQLGVNLTVQTGDAVAVESTDTLPSPLVDGQTYYSIRVDDSHIRLAQSYDAAMKGTAIGFSDSGVGVHKVRALSVIHMDNKAIFKTGDGVDVVCSGLTDGRYYAIKDVGAVQRVRLAVSAEDALSGNALVMSASGEVSISHADQARYTCNGAFTLEADINEVMESLLTSCGGSIVWANGAYRLSVASAQEGIETIDADWLRGDVEISKSPSMQDGYNCVRGTYVNPDESWAVTEFPERVSDAFVAQDAGEKQYRDIELPFTTDVVEAQRLAKMHLEQSRQGMIVQIPCNLRGWLVTANDIVYLNFPEFGFDHKPFRITAWSATVGVDLTLQEESSAVYQWNAGEITYPDPSPNTLLKSPFIVGVPGLPNVNEYLYAPNGASGGLKVGAAVSWAAAADGYVESYEVSYRRTGREERYVFLPLTDELGVDLRDLEPTRYDVRVRSINAIGQQSLWAEVSVDVKGLTAAPSDVTGLQMSVAGGLGQLRWDLHPDLDVRIGGHFVISHSPEMIGVDWGNSTSIAVRPLGAETSAIVPLKAGTYSIKARDSSGNWSVGAAFIMTKAAAVLNYSPVDYVSAHPVWSGALIGVAVEDTILKLVGAVDFDTRTGLVDDWSDWDFEGGVKTKGTYTFAAGLDFGSVKSVRLESIIKAISVNEIDYFDSRLGNVDDWPDWDGVSGGNADCFIEIKETDDNPNDPAAVWSDWKRLDAGEFEARGVWPRAILSTDNPSIGIHVSELTVRAIEVI